MLTFLHAADLHLGLRITRFDEERAHRIREARFRALANILKAAQEGAVDFLLIAGDLFDDHAVDALTARRAFEMLDSAPCPVFIIPGNHDPLLPGAVWDRPPWNTTAPRQVHLCRESQPCTVAPGVLLFPCPLYRKTSVNNPVTWVTQQPPDTRIRIGLAHGSLKVRDDLPIDDHLIDRNAAQQGKLDYLALGHWHRRQQFPGEDGVVRTAYCGVHEPMRFQGQEDDGTGWNPYTRGHRREEFADAGQGEVLHVTLPGPGEPPRLRPIDVGYLQWHRESRALASGAELTALIAEVSQRLLPERRLLSLKLSGTLDAEAMPRLQELEQILQGSYAYGALDTAALRLRPTAEQVRKLAGQGIVGGVAAKLETLRTDPAQAAIAEKALLVLYHLLQELPA